MWARWIGGIASAVLGLVCAVSLAHAQQNEVNAARQLLIVYDSSSSMWGELEDRSRKYEAGRTALKDFLDLGLDDTRIGMRAYGHRRASDCSDTELIVPISDGATASADILETAAGIRPTGRTPITRSLRESRNDLGAAGGDILLISDGIETCDIDPCELMSQWANAKVNIRVHVVGVGLNTIEQQAMTCIAERSGGTYFDVDDASEFSEAMTGARGAIKTPAGEPDTSDQDTGYALLLNGRDASGREYLTVGKIYKDGEEISDATSNGRNVLPGPGAYEIEVGPRLSDGSVYAPVRQNVTVEDAGETTTEVIVQAPARVTARFVTAGEDVRGALIRAYANGEEAFSFRPQDEALARPGTYEFRTAPNQDNNLSQQAVLTAGEAVEVVFDMTETVAVLVELMLPDGETIRRNTQLWRDDEAIYALNGSNPARVRPGVYELRSEHEKVPLNPVQVEIPANDTTLQIPLAAGFVTIAYASSDFDYFSNPNRAFLESIERGGSTYTRVDTPVPFAPGGYRVTSTDAIGFFDPVEFTIANNESRTVTLTPKPLGAIVVNYDSSADYETTPDRASASPLDGQAMRSGFMRPGAAVKFLPGRYRIEGWSRAGDFAPREVTVRAGETTTITLSPR